MSRPLAGHPGDYQRLFAVSSISESLPYPRQGFKGASGFDFDGETWGVPQIHSRKRSFHRHNLRPNVKAVVRKEILSLSCS